MFKFNFSDDGETIEERGEALEVEENETDELEGFREIALQDLIESLPTILSYSPLQIAQESSHGCPTVTLIRRDLFDARYQMIAQNDLADTSTTHGKSAVDFMDNPSDLVPCVYEGGLKTWECSVDLVEYFSGIVKRRNSENWAKWKRIFEIGCGTAIPSLYLLQEILNDRSVKIDSDPFPAVEIILQDYNDLVLRMVTFPNVLLTWYKSPLAKDIREKGASTLVEESQIFDPETPSELEINRELTEAFLESLKQHGINIQFFSGSWQSLQRHSGLFTAPFDFIFSSETIYSPASVQSLVDLLRTALAKRPNDDENDLENTIQKLAIHEDVSASTICLIAAKVLYFGVGGGVMEFEEALKRNEGCSQTVFQKTKGVGRKIMQILFN